MNSVELEISEQMLKLLGVKPENVKKHKSKRQIIKELTEFVNN